MTTAQDYAAMVADSGQELLMGMPDPVAMSTTMFGDQNSNIIKHNIGIETLATAFAAFDSIKPDPGAGTPVIS